MKKMKWLFLSVTLILLASLLVACSGDDTSTDANEDTNTENNESGSESESESESESVSGEVIIDGSSTVTPLMEAAMYFYNRDTPDVSTVMNTSGTGGGFKKFTVGDTDISMASRPIKEEEIAIAEENGVEYVELAVAYDGLSVVVSQENDFVEQMTVEQVAQIFLADGTYTKWSDLDPSYPDEDIIIYSPGHDSGTFDYFNEVILEENPMREGEGVTLSEDDNALVTGIVNDPYAIGYFGYAYYIENESTLKSIAIENGDGEFISPNPETIQSDQYSPLSRPLFVYVNKESLETKPQVKHFIKFLNQNSGESAEQVGYVAIPDTRVAEQGSLLGE